MTKVEKITISVSLLAILLTQFKPLYEYFETSDLNYDVGNYISFQDQVGYPVILFKLNIRNSGDKFGRLKKGYIYITQIDGVFNYVGSIVNAYDRPNGGMTPFNGVFLPPGGVWNNAVLTTDMEFNSNEKFIEESAYWQERVYAELGRYDEFEESKPVSKKLFDEFKSWYKDKWSAFPAGVYHILFVFDEEEETKELVFQFKISHQKKNMFFKNVERYRYGEGIVAPITTGGTMDSLLVEVSDKKIKDELIRSFSKHKI